MAKQTFTTGQVLTAAQMTSLQETAMGGGPATAKTTSYVLVAADAGKTVAMDAAGATTITVNTGLFAAGDTVFIQNLGAGACTVTAGTATVATAGSLILPQNDAGILYFTSASAAIFYDYIQVGATSPLTTKGDLYTFSTSDTRLGVGTDGHTLVADSGEATGLKWAAPSSGALVKINTYTFSGSSGQSMNDIFSATYRNYVIKATFDSTSVQTEIRARLRVGGSDNTSNNYRAQAFGLNSGMSSTALTGDGSGTIGYWAFNFLETTANDATSHMEIFNPFATAYTTFWNNAVRYRGSDSTNPYYAGTSTVTTSYTGLTIYPATGTMTGKIEVYGYAI
jgi:hypothetical protein